jgi:hypothetical protein
MGWDFFGESGATLRSSDGRASKLQLFFSDFFLSRLRRDTRIEMAHPFLLKKALLPNFFFPAGIATKKSAKNTE